MATFSGTSAVTNGSATVVFTGPTLSPLAVFPGAQVSLGGYFAVIASITNTTTFVLTSPFTGTTNASVPTTINTISENEADIVTLNTRTADLIEDLLEFDPLNNLASISPLTGTGVLYQDATGAHSLVPKTDLTNGVDTDGKANNLAQRDTLYGNRDAGFSVLVADVGDGRSAVYFKNSNTLNDWSNPAYLTGPTGGVGPAGVAWRGPYSAGDTYAINDGVTFNGSSFRKLTTVAAGTAPSSAIPPVNTTDWEVLAAKGETGSISGVTTFWQNRITVDTSSAQARTGLNAIGVGDFGVGSTNIPVETDLNSPSRATRFLRWGPTTLNRPEDFGSAIQIERAPDFLSQIASGANGNTYTRSFQIGSPTSWRTLWDSSSLPPATQAQAEAGTLTNMLAWSPERIRQAITALSSGANERVAISGTANAIILTSTAPLNTGTAVRFRAISANTSGVTISFSGGAAISCRTITGVALPSGYIRTDVDTIAIYDGTFWVVDRQIERGTNANGFYTRFADGTQLCGRETFSVAASVTTLTWPVAFSNATYSCFGSPISSFTTSLTSVKFSSFTTTNAQVLLTNAASGSSTISPVAASICFFAQGFWY